MKVHLIAVGTRMPAWVEEAVGEYRKRLPKNFELIITEVPLARRGKGANKGAGDVARWCEAEGKALLGATSPGQFKVALDVKGKALSTEAMADRVRQVMEQGRDLALLVGGPDGLSGQCLGEADESWSLSALTMPHTVVRIVVAEQIYRVWSVLNGHPYHRE